MKTIILCILTGLFCLSTTAGAQTTLKESRVPTGIAASLYTDGPYRNVLRMAAQGPWLYAAVRDLDGNQYIDVWRVQPPLPPEPVDRINYPTLQADAFVFTPLAIIPRDGVVLIQADSVLRTYRHAADGSLDLLGEFNLVTGLGVDQMRQLSAGGAFASHKQQVTPAQHIGDVPQDKWHQEVIVSLRDPAAPFLVRAPDSGLHDSFLNTDNPVNGVYNGTPASIAHDSQTRTVSLTTFERKLQSHLDTFWGGKLEALFQQGALDLTLEEHVSATLNHIGLPAMRAELLEQYRASLDLDAFTIEGMIRARHLGTDALRDVLEIHGLSLDESLQLSLRKLATEALDENLRADLGRLVFQPLLEAWLDETFGIVWKGLSSAELAAEIALSFDAQLDAEGVARYLTLYLIAPLLDDPAFMLWTLDDLIDGLVNSDIGALIDTTLTVTGAGAISSVLAAVDDLPGVSLPNCALFPGNARGLIDLALFSGGAKLDANGLAWFEMLKFYQYLTGGPDYEVYLAEVNAALRDLHYDLADDFTKKYLGFFSGIDGFLQTEDALASISESGAIDSLLGELLANAMIARLETAGHDTSGTLREFLKELNLPFNALDELTADVDGLVASLTFTGLHAETVAGLFVVAETVPFNLEGHLEAYLMAHLEAVFGTRIPSLSLRAALYAYLGEQFDLSGTLDGHLEGLLDAFSVEVYGEALFGAYLTQTLNAFDGDCIAQWLLTLDAATIIATPLLLEAYPLAAELALSSAYSAGVEAAISTMVSLTAETIIGDLSGDWASWTEQVVPTAWEFPVPASDGNYDVTVAGSFVWQDKVILVLSYRSKSQPFGPRRAWLHAFSPEDPDGGVRVDLGAFEKIDFVQQAGKEIIVAGRHPVGDNTGHALVIDLERMEGRHFTGDNHIELAVTLDAAILNDGGYLALRTETGIEIVPNLADGSSIHLLHSGDTNNDRKIDLAEVLRVIQIFNTGGYWCSDVQTEDGFDPVSGDRTCAPHNADYLPQDWRFSLPEILRVIQIFNLGGYTMCAESEDGFCGGA